MFDFALCPLGFPTAQSMLDTQPRADSLIDGANNTLRYSAIVDKYRFLTGMCSRPLMHQGDSRTWLLTAASQTCS